MKPKVFTLLKWSSLGIAASSTLGAFAYAYTHDYVVKLHDTLSNIASAHLPGKIYGPEGTLAKLTRLNPQIKNQNLLFPGEKVFIDDKGLKLARNTAGAKREVASDLPGSEPALPSAPVTESNQMPVVEKPKAFQAHGVVNVTPEYVSTSIVGKDSTNNTSANLVSNSNLGITANYGQILSEKLAVDLFFKFNQLSMKSPSNIPLDKTNLSYFGFGVHGNYLFAEGKSLGAGVGLYQRLYLKGVTSTSMTLDPLAVANVSADYKFDFCTSKPFTYSATVLAGFDLPKSGPDYNTKLNPMASGTLSFRHDVNEGFRTEAGVKASYLSANTSIIDQYETDFGVFVRLQYIFGKLKE